MGRTAEQRAWSKQFMNVTIIPSKKIEPDVTKWELLPHAMRQKLKDAIRLAPVMLDKTVQSLSQFYAWENPTRSMENWNTVSAGPDKVEQTFVGQALLKYFNLRHQDASGKVNPDYWRFVRGIHQVYEKAALGLYSPYELVVGWFDVNAQVTIRGRSKVQRDVSEIRETFGFNHEWGHSAFVTFDRAGRIQLSHKYLSQASEDLIAKTIIHEATHKWAGTRDVIYKHNTFHKTGFKDYEFQEREALPGRTKPLYLTSGFDAKSDEMVTAERLLENADSYAWTARRLWKRSERSGD